MNFAILDGASVFPSDISLDGLTSLGDFTIYESTTPETLISHIGNADGIIVNKSNITLEIMKSCPNLKYIGVTATGYNNIDLEAAKAFNVAVCNVPAYSTDAVAQHTFALILETTNHVGNYNKAVSNGQWEKCDNFCFMIEPLALLSGKSIGIIGYGNIGKKVAEIAKAFGMKVNIYSQDKEAAIKSDIVTLHCPATKENQGFINKEFISSMKTGAILINTARGVLINEEDLANGLKSGKLAEAAVDVLAIEPPRKPSPLFALPNCIITPHISWMPQETRQVLIDICAENLKSFLEGGNLNRIV